MRVDRGNGEGGGYGMSTGEPADLGLPVWPERKWRCTAFTSYSVSQ